MEWLRTLIGWNKKELPREIGHLVGAYYKWWCCIECDALLSKPVSKYSIEDIPDEREPWKVCRTCGCDEFKYKVARLHYEGEKGYLSTYKIVEIEMRKETYERDPADER